ncbi:MAG: zf-HC2 domain-containing protein, partial [Myxococcales bacterium]|nr:zf-HC2 domain-containing protein [Myxococcales bacterium]
MTHSESQDLLLDLTYGELDPARAQELEGHLAGCEECQREKAALDEARRLTAPLREMEEPSPGFDQRILVAARTQAQMDHDGDLGEVIEVSGNVRPLGLEAARIDAHGPIAARQERRKPRWAVRIALGGSVAAAAALALVVSTTLQNKRAVEIARMAESDKAAFQIRVQQPVAAVENEALRDAQKKDAVAVPPAPQQVNSVRPVERRAVALKKKAVRAPAANVGGSGGDALDVAADQPSAGAREVGALGQSSGGGQMGVASTSGPVAGKQAVPTLKPAEAPPPPAKEEPKHAVKSEVAEAQPAPRPAQVAAVAEAAAAAAVRSATDDRTAAEIEAEAQSARHRGNYALAATLYQKAADMRREAGDKAESAAWD